MRCYVPPAPLTRKIRVTELATYVDVAAESCTHALHCMQDRARAIDDRSDQGSDNDIGRENVRGRAGKRESGGEIKVKVNIKGRER